MRYKLIAIITLALSLSACGGSQRAQEQTARNQHLRITQMIDQRRYSDAIQLIEGSPEALAAFPDLLAMAYLGRADFEPLGFALKVAGTQSAASSGLEKLLPGCESEEIRPGQALQARCVLKRLFAHLPDADNTDFAMARSLLRSTFPDAASALPRYNTLIALVEASSALSRLGHLLLKFQSADVGVLSAADVTYALAQIEAIADEATRMLLRLEHSIAPVSQLLAGPDQEPLFGPSPNGTTWSERTLIPVVLKFASVSHPKVDTPETRDAIIEMLHELGI